MSGESVGGGELCLSPQEFLERAQEMLQLRTNYKPLLDVLMVLLLGVAAVLLLYRVLFGVPPPLFAASSSASSGSTSSKTGALKGSLKASKKPTMTTTGDGAKQSWNERIGLPKRSSYYSMPFFADTIATKQEFLEGLIELGNDPLEGWLLVKKGAQKGKTWKKRFVVLDANARLKYFANTDSARRNLNIKGSLTVYAVKPADVLMFGSNTLEVRGTLGGTYFFRAEDEMAARKWLCVLTKRAIEGGIPGRNDTIRLPPEQQQSGAAGGGDAGGIASGSSGTLGINLSRSLATNGISLGSSSFNSSSSTANANSSAPPVLKNHMLEVFVADMNYAKEAPMRQLYVVVKFKSDLHDHSSVPVGQTAPKSCEKGLVAWNEKLNWHFHDHICAECDECKRGGCHAGTFVGLPDLMVVHVYEIALRVITTKIGHTTISLRELMGFSGIKNSAMECSWPILSSSNKMLGNLMLKVNYNVALAGGDALTPFLVSSEEERELICETDVNPAVKDVKQFFKLLYDNQTEAIWEGYRKERGETELVVGEWVESKEHGGQIRVLTFRALTHASIGPASTMTTMTQHVNFVKEDEMDMKKFALEVRMLMRDIPYGDCFSIEQMLVVAPKEGGTNLVAKLYLAIPFSKGCMFKSKIISATKAGIMASFQIQWKHLNDELGAKLGGGATGGAASASKSSGSVAGSASGTSTGEAAASNNNITATSGRGNSPASSSGSSPASRHGATRTETTNSSGTSAQEPSSNTSSVATGGGAGDANTTGAPSSSSSSATASNRKLLMAQLNSTQDGSIALEEVFENQRMSLFGKWGPNHLLPTDRARFTNRNGDVELSFEKVVLPPNWVWTSPWKIDRNYTDCDEEGWSYASDFPRFKSHLQRGRSSMKKLGSSVRRRRWIRTMCYVPPQDESAAKDGEASAMGPVSDSGSSKQ